MNHVLEEPPSRFSGLKRTICLLTLVSIANAHANTLTDSNCQYHIAPVNISSISKAGETQANAELQLVQKLQTDLQAECGTDLATCDDQEIKQFVEEAVSRSAPSIFNKWWDFSSIALRRTSVVGMWAGTIILPPAIVAVMTQKLPPFLSAVATLIAMNMSASIFMYLRTPIDQRLGPPMAKFAMRIWKPAPGDHWGNVVAGVNENERAVSELLGPMIIIIRDYLADAGVALASGDTKLAAVNYLEAIRQSLHQYNGVNIGHDAIVDMVHSRIDRNNETIMPQITAETVAQLLQHCHLLIDRLSEKQIPKGYSRDGLKAFTSQTINHWFN